MPALIVRNNIAVENYLREHPFARIGKVLSGGYIIIYVPEDKVDTIAQEIGIAPTSSYPLVVGLMGKEALDISGITQVQQQPFLNLTGRGVLLGFIDTGIDYTKEAFRYEDDTSKVQFIWDQTADGPAPSGYPFGTEYTNDQINQALKSPDPFSIVGQRDTVGHGTFLASVAAGREKGEYMGAAPDAELIVVKLRKAGSFFQNYFLVPESQENVFETGSVMMGIEYILDKAVQLNRPVAICISVGTNLSGHDGFNIFEEYISRISHRPGVTICCAAGDEGNARHHTQGTIAKTGDIQKIQISVGENAGSFLQSIWNNASDRISIAVTSPTGEVVGRIPAKNGTFFTERLILERSTVKVGYYFPIEGSGSQLTSVRIIDATPGIWTISIYGDIIIDGRYHAWLPITGFVHPSVAYLSPSPNTTVVVPAAATGDITVGAYNSLDKSLYAASSWGPNRLMVSLPDLTAPGVEVMGTTITGHGRMEGTSVAAAVTSGACALLLQWGIVERNEPTLNTYLARAYLIRGCDRDPGLEYPNYQWGYGRLNLINTFNSLRRTQG